MKKILLLVFILFLLSSTPSFAIYDPLLVNNNKFGVHILFPDEIQHAKNLVNSSNGEWGYVIIPIQAFDKNIDKWQKFMDDARSTKIIPIIRLATNGDYFNTTVWERPKTSEIIDFANFLDSVEWPTKNRYIVVYNEVNRADEWGGSANPSEYAEILSFAIETFKSKNPDFFIISAGLDNASSTRNGTYNPLEYLRLMELASPGIFERLDGFSSHSYPNPGFSQPPWRNNIEGISSFQYELDVIKNFTSKDLPVFITETGWVLTEVDDKTQAEYYKYAFENAWADPRIVAVTPFLLFAQGEPFTKFSLLKGDLQPSLTFKSIQSIQKVKGAPQIAPYSPTKVIFGKITSIAKDFSGSNTKSQEELNTLAFSVLLRWLFNF